LLLIQEQLKRQSERNKMIENQAERQVTQNMFEQELKEAFDRKSKGFEDYI